MFLKCSLTVLLNFITQFAE